MCQYNGAWWSWVTKILVIIGGVNWGLIGLSTLFGSTSSWNVVEMIFGGIPWLLGLIYLLVGISAIVEIFNCKCSKKPEASTM